MRPDEHKKKRNAQYKKKHNITGKSAAARGENKSTEPAEHPKQELKIGHSPSGVTAVSARASGSVDIKRSEGNESRQFSRRKVTSNWDKYEELIVSSDSSNDGEEENTHSMKAVRKSRGADFTTLIKNTADPSSQFRFQSEKEWEETDSKSQVLEINVDMLARSLQSLPLHNRLALEVENIHPDLLEGFNNIAGIVVQEPQKLNVTESSQVKSELVSSQHQSRRHKQVIASFDTEDKSYKELGFSESVTREFGSLTISDSAHSVEQNVTVKQKSLSAQLHSSLKDIASSGPTVVLAAETMQSAVKAEMGQMAIEDDELDLLLSLDTPSGTSNQVVNSMSREENKAISLKKYDKELATGQMQASKNCISSQENSKAETNQDELEDWLDSVLG